MATNIGLLNLIQELGREYFPHFFRIKEPSQRIRSMLDDESTGFYTSLRIKIRLVLFGRTISVND